MEYQETREASGDLIRNKISHRITMSQKICHRIIQK